MFVYKKINLKMSLIKDPFKIDNKKFQLLKCGGLENFLENNKQIVDLHNLTKYNSLVEQIDYEFKKDILNENVNFSKFKSSFTNSNNWFAYTLINGPKGIILIPNFFKKEYSNELFNELLFQLPVKKNHLLKSNINLPIVEKDINESKLRWLTFGYHYDWTNKIYNKQDYNKFPKVLNELLICLKHILNLNLKLEGGIVNFYTCKSKLNPHSDCRELDKKSPLLSISLGEPGIFLLGTNNRYEEPVTPILLRNGDIMIMSDVSRLSYHSIVKIVCKDKNCEKKNLKRININVRQVY